MPFTIGGGEAFPVATPLTTSLYQNVASGVYVTLLNFTGEGFLYRISATPNDDANYIDVEITIDGGVPQVLNSIVNVREARNLRDNVVFFDWVGTLKFNSSILVRTRQNTGFNQNIEAVLDYGIV